MVQQQARPRAQQFASDNWSGICPEALESLEQVNASHHIAYGDDRWTAEVCDLFRELFGVQCEVFFVFNGTAGNALALAALCQPYHAVICHRLSHVQTDECAAPEFFSGGAKLMPLEGPQGKLQARAIEEIAARPPDIHVSKPRAISLTQATELGTVYTPAELLALGELADKYALKIHMDGARFANAVASLGVKPAEITVDCGVDVLCFGGSKNGLAVGEAVIFFDAAPAEEFAYRCKQAGQLASKMRFVAAQWLGVLETGAWLKYAENANHCASELERLLGEIAELRIVVPCQANAVFVEIPQAVIESLHAKGWYFHTRKGMGGSRLMCSWDTTLDTVHAFVEDVKVAVMDSR